MDLECTWGERRCAHKRGAGAALPPPHGEPSLPPPAARRYSRRLQAARGDSVPRCGRQVCIAMPTALAQTVPVQGLPTAICSQQPGSLPHDVADLDVYYPCSSGEEARQRQGSGQG